MRFLMWLTGGRPMKQGKYLFGSILDGKSVYYFTDYYGRKWMAKHKWSLFRVATLKGNE
jgi:hypothetical protein